MSDKIKVDFMLARIRVRSKGPLVLWPGTHRDWKKTLEVVKGKLLQDGCVYGIPAGTFKRVMVEAARWDEVGMDKVRGVVQVMHNKPSHLVRIKSGHPSDHAAIVTHQGQTFTRMRPRFTDWSATLRVKFIKGEIGRDDIVRLLQYAGSHVGIGDFRPQCGGSNGTFEVV
jgi:hypothetical protein